jgi:hypothetical protein
VSIERINIELMMLICYFLERTFRMEMKAKADDNGPFKSTNLKQIILGIDLTVVVIIFSVIL